MPTDLTDIGTLMIGVAALVASVVAYRESRRQGSNSVRPVLIVLDKYTDNSNRALGRSLYLVNMGQAVAIDVRVLDGGPSPKPLDASENEDVLDAIAAGRRTKLLTGYAEPIRKSVSLKVEYKDVNGTTYRTIFEAGRHEFTNTTG